LFIVTAAMFDAFSRIICNNCIKETNVSDAIFATILFLLSCR